MRILVIGALTTYRRWISPMLGQRCRYYPSCSAYAVGAVQAHGVVRGLWLALRRLGRCHPWSPGGVDLVPSRETYRWWGIAADADGEDHNTESLPSRQSPTTPNPPINPDLSADMSARPGA